MSSPMTLLEVVGNRDDREKDEKDYCESSEWSDESNI